MANFTGQLGSNEIFSALFNMIISQQVFAEPIKGTFSSLVDRSRVDGSLHGDRKLFYSSDVLKSYVWNNDSESGNLLKLYRPAAPECQEIILDVFRQIPLTVDYYLTKRAWSTEGAFNDFNSVMLGWIRNTKRVYDATTFNAFIGTNESTIGKQSQTITLPTITGNPEAQARMRAQTIAKKLADIVIDLTDVTRDYNDYGFLRSYSPSDLIIVWNAKQHNEITKLDLPTIFHKDGLLGQMEQVELPARYFGNINKSGASAPVSNKTIRALHEIDFNEYEMSDPRYEPKKHLFAGDLLPDSEAYLENETYTEDDKILFKIMDKRSVPFMSAFEVGTTFFNPKSLTENHYLTWGHNKLEHLAELPFITVKATEGKAAAK